MHLFLHHDLFILIISHFGVEEKSCDELSTGRNNTLWWHHYIKWLLWFIYEISPKGLCVESLVTCASVLRIWVLWKWLDLGGPDLKQLVHWTVNGLLGNGRKFRHGGDSEEVGHLGHVLESLYFGVSPFTFSSLFSCLHYVNLFSLCSTNSMIFCLTSYLQGGTKLQQRETLSFLSQNIVSSLTWVS